MQTTTTTNVRVLSESEGEFSWISSYDSTSINSSKSGVKSTWEFSHVHKNDPMLIYHTSIEPLISSLFNGNDSMLLWMMSPEEFSVKNWFQYIPSSSTSLLNVSPVLSILTLAVYDVFSRVEIDARSSMEVLLEWRAFDSNMEEVDVLLGTKRVNSAEEALIALKYSSESNLMGNICNKITLYVERFENEHHQQQHNINKFVFLNFGGSSDCANSDDDDDVQVNGYYQFAQYAISRFMDLPTTSNKSSWQKWMELLEGFLSEVKCVSLILDIYPNDGKYLESLLALEFAKLFLEGKLFNSNKPIVTSTPYHQNKNASFLTPIQKPLHQTNTPQTQTTPPSSLKSPFQYTPTRKEHNNSNNSDNNSHSSSITKYNLKGIETEILLKELVTISVELCDFLIENRKKLCITTTGQKNYSGWSPQNSFKLKEISNLIFRLVEAMNNFSEFKFIDETISPWLFEQAKSLANKEKSPVYSDSPPKTQTPPKKPTHSSNDLSPHSPSLTLQSLTTTTIIKERENNNNNNSNNDMNMNMNSNSVHNTNTPQTHKSEQHTPILKQTQTQTPPLARLTTEINTPPKIATHSNTHSNHTTPQSIKQTSPTYTNNTNTTTAVDKNTTTNSVIEDSLYTHFLLPQKFHTQSFQPSFSFSPSKIILPPSEISASELRKLKPLELIKVATILKSRPLPSLEMNRTVLLN